MTTKICKKCGMEKPRTSEYFPKHKNNKDGLLGTCKACRSEYLKQYQKENAEKLKEYHKKYHEEYKVKNKELILERGRIYRTVHREKKLESSRKWRINNPDKVKKQQSKWWRENRLKANVYKERRRSLMEKLPSDLTEKEWEETIKYFNKSCAYCGNKTNNLQQEHFIPVSKKGAYTKHNIIPSCKSCNFSKHVKDFNEWYPKQPFYTKEREQKILNFIETYRKDSVSKCISNF